MSQLLADLPDELPPEDDRPDAVDLHRKGKRSTLGRASYHPWKRSSFGSLPMADRSKRFVPDWALDPALLPRKPPGGRP